MAGSDEPIEGVGMRSHLQISFNSKPLMTNEDVTPYHMIHVPPCVSKKVPISQVFPISLRVKLTSICQMVSFRL